MTDESFADDSVSSKKIIDDSGLKVKSAILLKEAADLVKEVIAD